MINPSGSYWTQWSTTSLVRCESLKAPQSTLLNRDCDNNDGKGLNYKNKDVFERPRSCSASSGLLAFSNQNRYGETNTHPQSPSALPRLWRSGSHWPLSQQELAGVTLVWIVGWLRMQNPELADVPEVQISYSWFSQLTFTYLASVRIRIVCWCFTETQDLIPNKWQRQENLL